MTSTTARRVWRILSAIVLLITGGIHLFLVLDGVGGLLGILFILNAVAAIVLTVAVLATRGALLIVSAILGLLFLVASLSALLLALTVGLFGITETWTFTLVPETVIVEAIGIVVLVITNAMVGRRRAGRTAR